MKCGSHLAKCLLLAPALVIPVAVFITLVTPRPPAELRMKEINDNPENFFLRIGKSNYDYGFIYNPRVADEWLFHTGGPVRTNH